MITNTELNAILAAEYADVDNVDYEPAEIDGYIFERYNERPMYIHERITADNKLVRLYSPAAWDAMILEAQDDF